MAGRKYNESRQLNLIFHTEKFLAWLRRIGPSVILVAQLLFRPPITVVVNPITPMIIYQSKVVCCLINSVSSCSRKESVALERRAPNSCKRMEQKN
ncbi:hypothetical protein BHM03_00019177 [Ensete ventricosum]|nr:hypothetical protein BHM03_00019177 [Ensete ventricosum]